MGASTGGGNRKVQRRACQIVAQGEAMGCSVLRQKFVDELPRLGEGMRSPDRGGRS